MKHFLLCLLLGTLSLAAQAPERVTGMVYRDAHLVQRGRSAGERTIYFENDERFVTLKYAWIQQPAVSLDGGRVRLTTQEGDGIYKYTRSGTQSGVLELKYADGRISTLNLVFDSAESGTVTDQLVLDLVFRMSARTKPSDMPLSNVALRGRVSSGSPFLVGFVVPGQTAYSSRSDRLGDPSALGRDVLIRAIGPSLVQFGITGFWADPGFKVFSGAREVHVLEAIYDDWGTAPEGLPAPNQQITEQAFSKVFAFAGAFPLLSGSKDACAVLRLAPGSYSIAPSLLASDSGGEVLIEVYILP